MNKPVRKNPAHSHVMGLSGGWFGTAGFDLIADKVYPSLDGPHCGSRCDRVGPYFLKDNFPAQEPVNVSHVSYRASFDNVTRSRRAHDVSKRESMADMRKSRSLPSILFAFLGIVTFQAIDLMAGGKVHAAISRHPVIFLLGPLVGIFFVVLVDKFYGEYRD
jgi:hypothetical protein